MKLLLSLIALAGVSAAQIAVSGSNVTAVQGGISCSFLFQGGTTDAITCTVGTGSFQQYFYPFNSTALTSGTFTDPSTQDMLIYIFTPPQPKLPYPQNQPVLYVFLYHNNIFVGSSGGIVL